MGGRTASRARPAPYRDNRSDLPRLDGIPLAIELAAARAVALGIEALAARQALDWASRQGALSWELRAATSLARLLGDQGRSADALALLQRVYDRFTEGFNTADLKAAKALLGALAELDVPQTRIS